jgi:hypothetical protein
LAFGISIDLGGFLVVVLEALVEVGKRSVLGGEGVGKGEYGLSEKVVVEDAGDAMPPHPKNDPNLEPPGDFGWNFWAGAFASDDGRLETLRAWGGAGFVEKTDMVAEAGWLVELEPLYHGPVDSVAGVVVVDSLPKRACFASRDSAG